MKPEIRTKPAFTVVGMKYHGNNNNREIPQLWDQLFPREGEIKHAVRPAASYGIMDNLDPATGELDYVAGLGVESVESLPEGMVRWDVPAGKYAIFPAKLTDNLPAIYHEIYTDWLPQSEYERGGTPDFEYYDEHFNAGDSPFYIYIALKG